MDCMRHYCEKITQRNFNEKNYIKNRFNYKLFVQPENKQEKKTRLHSAPLQSLDSSRCFTRLYSVLFVATLTMTSPLCRLEIIQQVAQATRLNTRVLPYDVLRAVSNRSSNRYSTLSVCYPASICLNLSKLSYCCKMSIINELRFDIIN